MGAFESCRRAKLLQLCAHYHFSPACDFMLSYVAKLEVSITTFIQLVFTVTPNSDYPLMPKKRVTYALLTQRPLSR